MYCLEMSFEQVLCGRCNFVFVHWVSYVGYCSLCVSVHLCFSEKMHVGYIAVHVRLKRQIIWSKPTWQPAIVSHINIMDVIVSPNGRVACPVGIWQENKYREHNETRYGSTFTYKTYLFLTIEISRNRLRFAVFL